MRRIKIHPGQRRKLKSLGFELKPGWHHGDTVVYWQRTIGESTLILAMMTDRDPSYADLGQHVAQQAAYRAAQRIKAAIVSATLKSSL